MKPIASQPRGFTLVELIVVLVILGVLAAVAGPRFAEPSVFEARGFYDELVAALNAAQKYAIATGCPVRFESDASGYASWQQRVSGGRCDPNDMTWSTAVVLSDGSPLARSVPSAVSASPDFTVTFDPLGATDLNADQTLTVGSFSLTIHAESGYIEAQ